MTISQQNFHQSTLLSQHNPGFNSALSANQVNPAKLCKLAFVVTAAVGNLATKVQAQSAFIFSNADVNTHVLTSIKPTGECNKTPYSTEVDCYLKFSPKIYATGLQKTECGIMKSTFEKHLDKYPIRGTQESGNNILHVDVSARYPKEAFKCVNMQDDDTGDIMLMSVTPQLQLIPAGEKPDTLDIPQIQLLALSLSETGCLTLLESFQTMIDSAPKISQKREYTSAYQDGLLTPRNDLSNKVADTQIRCVNAKTNEEVNYEKNP